jgi:hypothetical protein
LLNETRRFGCELTQRFRAPVSDLNGILVGEPWETQPSPAPRARPSAEQAR